MPRIACMWVPDFCLHAHLRLDPCSATKALAWSGGFGSRDVIVGLTTPAAGAGIAVGMRVSQARAVNQDVAIRVASPEALGAAMTALVDVAGTVSARVEVDDRGLVFSDCDGTVRLWASESELAGMLAARAAHCGLPAWVGIADSKLGASVAARESGGTRIVPQGRTKDFLAPFPIKYLDPDPGIAAMLAGWGIRSIGELAALPTGALAHRLGKPGALLALRANGTDVIPLIARAAPRTFEEAITLEYSVDRLEALVFILRRLIECVARRIELYGLACHALELRLELEGGGQDLRTLRPAAPTVDQKILVTVVRAALESRPPAHAVIGVWLNGIPIRVRPTQLDLLRPTGPAPDALASTLARLAIMCGPDRVGILRKSDTHRPDALEVETFDGVVTPPVDQETQPSGDRMAAKPGAVVRLALRAFRPPVPLDVFESKGCLDFVRGRGFGGRVVQWAGPRRLRGEWWTAEPFAREYYDVELSDGGVYRIYRDVRRQSWLADGVYD